MDLRNNSQNQKHYFEKKMVVAAKEDKRDQIIFLSDVHFGARGDSMDVLQNMKDYFYNFFIPFVKEQIERKNHPIIVIAGDYFDNRTHIDINVMNVAKDVMDSISSLCPVYMVIGNHDIYKKSDTDVTSLRLFADMYDVTIVYDMAELILKDNVRILLTSWIGDMKKENKIIAENKDKYNLLVFHTELSGMTYDNGRSIINGLNIDIVDDGKIVSGHIHKRQESKKGIYLGSPYHIRKDDMGNRKGIYTFSIEDGKLVKNFTENTYSPEYVIRRFSDIGRNVDDWKDIVRNNYVHIIFTTEELNVVNISKFMNELRSYEPRNIEIIEERPNVNINDSSVSVNEDGEIVDLSVDPDASLVEIFETKLKAFKLKKTEMKKINKLNEEYLKRAVEES